MTKTIKLMSLAAVVGFLALSQTGCLYTHLRTPLDRDFDATVLGTRQGQSDIHCVAWLFTWGDGGTRAAAEDGDLTVIRHADMEVESFLFGLYSRVSTIVYGD